MPMRTGRNVLLLIVTMLVLLVRAAHAGPPGPLVDAAWLAAHQGEVTILDVRRSEEDFVAGSNVAGAVCVPWGAVRVNRSVDGGTLVGMLPDSPDFEALMRRSGVSDDTPLVIVNGGRNAAQVTFATRLYWQLQYYGHDDMALLDGGMAAWTQAGLPVVHDAPAPAAPGGFAAGTAREDILATTDEVAQIAASQPAVLFDARDFGQYLGLYHDPRSMPRGGHIPGARFMPIDAFLNPGPVKTFVNRNTLRAAMVGLGADEAAVTYCNTGHFASGTWFVLHELAGNRKAQLYDGSLNAWALSGLSTCIQS